MKPLLTVAIVAVMILTSLLFGGRVVFAADTICSGSLGAVTVGNLRVPANRSCTLTGTRVTGSITVETNAYLTATRATISGSIISNGGKVIKVTAGTTVGGSIQAKEGCSAKIDGARITRDLVVEADRAVVSLTNNSVGGNLVALRNTSSTWIAYNTIKGNLSCTGNNPAPRGRGNIVTGAKLDQCSRL